MGWINCSDFHAQGLEMLSATRGMWLLDNLLTIAIVTALAVICAFVGYMFFRRKKHH
ncbi:MAG: hypothetical protein IJY66_03020 [Clostridia bacterium]|nr:hypothetical protein [Clostridia bacterium]